MEISRKYRGSERGAAGYEERLPTRWRRTLGGWKAEEGVYVKRTFSRDTPCLSEKVPPSENFEERSIFCERLSVGRKGDAERPSKKNTWIEEERSGETPFRPAFVYEQSPKHEEVRGKKFTDETVKKRGIGQYRTQLISIAQLPTDFLPLRLLTLVLSKYSLENAESLEWNKTELITFSCEIFYDDRI
ncbi:hypothetical protein V1477_000767 [Vespula maculifrons]|uniref:Uncharacterized protein n=1 Tax=Vespula maculifrons TaxID=7453 RepID=A0ABD2D137_VESMC